MKAPSLSTGEKLYPWGVGIGKISNGLRYLSPGLSFVNGLLTDCFRWVNLTLLHRTHTNHASAESTVRNWS